MADLVVVEAGGRRLAIPAARVREVAAVSTVTPVATAPAPVLGLTQLRGQIIPVLDLALWPVPSPTKSTSQLVNFPDDPDPKLTNQLVNFPDDPDPKLTNQLVNFPDDPDPKLTNQLVNFPDEARTPRPQDPLVVVELGPARAALWVDRVLGVLPATDDDLPIVEIGALFDQLRAAVGSQVAP